MNKNTLVLLAVTTTLLVMVTGCATQVAVNPTDTNTTSTVDNTLATTTKKVAAKGIDEYLIDPLGPDTYYGRSPVSFSNMQLKQPQQVKVYSLGSEIKDGTYQVTITLLSDTSWADGKYHEFYFELNAEGESLYYGPFENNILKLQQDASKKENYIQEKDAVVKNNKPVITFPANGSTVKGVTIKGTAKPNSEIWAYVNYSKNELACISINSYASGGGSTVDSKGNFEFALAEPCSKDLTVVVSTEDPAADKTGACRSSENVSELITFTNSGKLPGICNQ